MPLIISFNICNLIFRPAGLEHKCQSIFSQFPIIANALIIMSYMQGIRHIDTLTALNLFLVSLTDKVA